MRGKPWHAFARCELELLGHKEPEPRAGPALWAVSRSRLPTHNTHNTRQMPNNETQENTTRLENNQSDVAKVGEIRAFACRLSCRRN